MKKINQYLKFVLIFSLIPVLFSCQEETPTSTSTDMNNETTSDVVSTDNQAKENKQLSPKEGDKKKSTALSNENIDDDEDEEEEKFNIKTLKPEEMQYYVGFYDIDLTPLQQGSIGWEEIPSYNGPTPSYSDSKFDYTFIGWTNTKGGTNIVSFEPVHESKFYYAVYNKTEKYVEPTPVEEPPAPACERTDELWYITVSRDEDRVEHISEEIDIPYVTHLLSYIRYSYTDFGYVQCGNEEKEGTTVDNSHFSEGQYYHSDGSVCPYPESHNIH